MTMHRTVDTEKTYLSLTFVGSGRSKDIFNSWQQYGPCGKKWLNLV